MRLLFRGEMHNEKLCLFFVAEIAAVRATMYGFMRLTVNAQGIEQILWLQKTTISTLIPVFYLLCIVLDADDSPIYAKWINHNRCKKHAIRNKTRPFVICLMRLIHESSNLLYFDK